MLSLCLWPLGSGSHLYRKTYTALYQKHQIYFWHDTHTKSTMHDLPEWREQHKDLMLKHHLPMWLHQSCFTVACYNMHIQYVQFSYMQPPSQNAFINPSFCACYQWTSLAKYTQHFQCCESTFPTPREGHDIKAHIQREHLFSLLFLSHPFFLSHPHVFCI